MKIMYICNRNYVIHNITIPLGIYAIFSMILFIFKSQLL